VARRDGWDRLITSYWKPVYKYVRLRWHKEPDDAQDLTQGFFSQALEKEPFVSYDPSKGTFRTFLRTCLDAYLNNADRAERRLKRGGAITFDYAGAEAELRFQVADPQMSAEEQFHREWQRRLFALAVEDLKERSPYFALFERHVLTERPPSYAELAEEFGISVTTVTNRLAAAKRDLRRCALERLREMTLDEREFRREARALLGGAGE
jgi:RNA polymerase sigma factor (sigma-70 family)